MTCAYRKLSLIKNLIAKGLEMVACQWNGYRRKAAPVRNLCKNKNANKNFKAEKQI